MSDQPKPHKNGCEAPATPKQGTVPAHSGVKYTPAEMPSKDARLPSPTK